MKKILKFTALALAALMTVIGCSSEELNTDQYSDNTLAFSAFGPNPVFRGSEITILGSNLDQVSQIVIPGVDPITSFTVTGTGRECKLVFTVPVDGPEVGKITIVGKDGTTLSSLVDLTYTEPIVFTSFSPAEAMPGDVITITGDYLNLVQEVIFPDGVYATEFESQSRYEIKVKVPSHAVTGRLIVGDQNEVLDPDNIANKVYSEGELTIGDPTVSKLSVSDPKPGTTLTISGSYLDMIKTIVFADGVEVEDFTVSEDGKTITVSIPSTAKTGDVVAVSYAGTEFTAGSIEMVTPSGLEASPAPVKAGADLKISGEDLDIVTNVNVPGAGDVAFSYADGTITLNVPAKATEGAITLTMANGDAVTVDYTLVHPTVTAVSPVELKAGETITIEGTDLDLITGVKLGGKDESFEYSDGKIVVTTTATSVSGTLVLSLANGETLEPSEQIALSYDSLIIVNEMPSAEHIGATVTLKGERFMLIENIYIGDAKVTEYVLRSDNEISFIMPYNSVGTYPVSFQLLNGDTEVCPQQIEVLLEIQYINAWEGNVDITWGTGGRVLIPAIKFNDVKAGAKMRFYYTQKENVWSQAQMNYGDWSGINFNGVADGAVQFNQTLVPTDIYGWFSDGILDRVTEVVLTKEILENIQAKKGDCDDVTGCGIIIQGSDLIFTKVEILQEIPQETTVWEGERYTGNYATNLELGGEDDWVNAGMEEGAEVRVYFTADNADEWSMQIFDGHWGGMMFPQFNQDTNPDAAGNGYISFEASGDVYTKMTTKAWWGYALIVQGNGITVTKLAFK